LAKFFIADDHAVVRRGLTQILGEAFPLSSFGEATNAHEIFAGVERQTWDLLILDISLPDKNGLDVLKHLKAARPELSVLVLSMHSEAEYAVRALKSGASGYLCKDSIPEELVTAVKRVLGGGRYVSSSLAENLALDLSRKDEAHRALSDREYEVMLMVASGRSLKEIADTLCLSVQSVSTYKRRVFDKMNFATNADLIRYVIDHKLE
jgi:two-component system, NarL family, invasion response regulator UvrY